MFPARQPREFPQSLPTSPQFVLGQFSLGHVAEVRHQDLLALKHQRAPGDQNVDRRALAVAKLGFEVVDPPAVYQFPYKGLAALRTDPQLQLRNTFAEDVFQLKTEAFEEHLIGFENFAVVHARQQHRVGRMGK